MSEPSTEQTANIMAWNIQSGGFKTYDPTEVVAARELPLLETIAGARESQAINTLSLSDAYRWDEIYGGEEGIARHLGYSQARFIRLDDERLNRANGAGVGIAFATNKTIERSWPLDLDTRQALGVVLGIGRYGLQIANVYLDDLSEDVRYGQARALLHGLEPDVPTLLVGDFNILRPDMKGARPSVRARDVAVRALASVISSRSELGITIKGMNQRRVVDFMESQGYRDADGTQKRPTAPAKLPLFGVDYAFYGTGVEVSNFQVGQNTGASDHRPITFTARVAD